MKNFTRIDQNYLSKLSRKAMNTDLLRTFIEIARTRHFGNAAENLYLTQSAVSSRVKQLEALVGVELFARQRNNILLTAAGERLLPHAENVLAAWQLALQDVGVANTQNMQLTLGGTSNLWDTFLRSFLPKLAGRFPTLNLRTDINSPQELTRALLGGRTDLIVVMDPPANLEFESTHIGQIELMMVANQPNLTVADIPDVGHVFVDWGSALNVQQAKLFSHPVAPVLNTGQSSIALEFVLVHGGAAFLPTALVAPYLVNKQLFRIEGAQSAQENVYVVYAKMSEKVKTIKSIVSEFEQSGLGH